MRIAGPALFGAGAAGGGGPDADLEPGGRGYVFFVVVLTFGTPQALVLGGCVALGRWLGPRSTAGIAAGAVVELVASVFYLCGGAGHRRRRSRSGAGQTRSAGFSFG
ncbi:hypothetical protein [Dactylosporangium sp. NPDC000521]|uniref:hypothetical protein n=1 Tax=Dactylosporangium sp. NPDC000521 TaxID=3363975 RepID=UPI00369C28DA